MMGLLISEIANWSQIFRCHLTTPKPVFLFLATAALSRKLLSLLDFLFELLLATAALYPKLVSFLAGLLYGCHPVSRVCLPPSFWAALGCSYRRVSPFLAVFLSLRSYIFGFYVCFFGGISGPFLPCAPSIQNIGFAPLSLLLAH